MDDQLKSEFLEDELRVFVAPVDILDVPDLTIYEQMAYIVIRSHCSPRNRTAFPSYATIGREGRMSRRQAIYAINGLIEKGLLTKEEQFKVSKSKKIQNASNLYTVKTPKISKQTAAKVTTIKPSKVVQDMHQGSAGHAPGVVQDMHQGSAGHAPKQDHLTDPFEQDHLNNNKDNSVVVTQIESYLGKSIKSLLPLLNEWIEKYGLEYLLEKAQYLGANRSKIKNIVGAYRTAVTENYETALAEIAATSQESRDTHDRYLEFYKLFPDN